MVDVKTEITIKANVEKVYSFASNPDNAPEWYVNIKSVEWKTVKPYGLGSQVAFKAQFLGKQLAYTYQCVELIPHKKLVMRTSEGPFPMETTYTWESIDNNTTLMTLRNQGNPTGFSRLFAPFMVLAMRKANKKDLKLAKAILER